jgi:hypothetical protein
MADEVNAEASLRVDVQGEQDIRNLIVAMATLGRAADQVNAKLKPTAVNAAGAAAMRETTQQVQKQGEHATKEITTTSTRIIERAFRGFGVALSEPFYAGGRVMRRGIRAFAASVSPMLRGLSPMSVGVVAAGLAITGFLGTAIKLGIGLKMLGVSFGWAQEQAAHAQAVSAATKRSFPGATGTTLIGREAEIDERLATLGAIVGEGADKLNQQIAKKVREGNDEAMRRWGITQGGVARFESTRPGGPRKIDALDLTEQFIAAREKAEAELKRNPTGARADQLTRMLSRFGEDTIEILGESLSNAAQNFSTADWKRLRANMAQNTKLGRVDNATRIGVDFTIAERSLFGTFEAIKRGIAGDVMPTMSKAMDKLREKLVGVGTQGEGLGESLRRLGTSFALAAWKHLTEVIDELLSPENLKEFSEWTKSIAEANAKDTANSLKSFVRGLLWVGRAFATTVSTLGKIGDFLGTIWTGAKVAIGWLAEQSVKGFGFMKNIVTGFYEAGRMFGDFIKNMFAGFIRWLKSYLPAWMTGGETADQAASGTGSGGGIGAGPGGGSGRSPMTGSSPSGTFGGVMRRLRTGGGATVTGGGAAVGTTPNPALLDAISVAEGTKGRGDYDAVLGYGKFGLPPKPITEMTLAEAYKFGRTILAKHGRSSAIGRFQIVGRTMMWAAKELKLDPNTTLYNKETQEKLATFIAGRQGLRAWEGFKFNPKALEDAQKAIAAGPPKEGTSAASTTGSSFTGLPRIFSPPLAPSRIMEGFESALGTKTNAGSRNLLDTANMMKVPGMSGKGDSAAQGTAFGSAAASTFLKDLGTVNIGLNPTGSGTAPNWTPAPTGADTATD